MSDQIPYGGGMEDKLSQIDISLQLIANLLAAIALQSDDMKGKNTRDRILYLSNLGFSDNNIVATLVGSTTGNVQKELSLAKKK